jgi:hypothetical protein
MAQTVANRTPLTSQPSTWQPLPELPELSQWTMEQPLPTTLNRSKLETEIQQTKAAQKPANPREYVTAVAKLVKFATAFGLPVGNAELAQEIYHETLSTLPADLLHLAISRTVKSFTWGNRMPLPAEILGQIATEQKQRNSYQLKLETALMKWNQSQPFSNAQSEPKRITPEELDAIMKPWRSKWESAERGKTENLC